MMNVPFAFLNRMPPALTTYPRSKSSSLTALDRRGLSRIDHLRLRRRHELLSYFPRMSGHDTNRFLKSLSVLLLSVLFRTGMHRDSLDHDGELLLAPSLR